MVKTKPNHHEQQQKKYLLRDYKIIKQSKYLVMDLLEAARFPG